MARPQTLYRAPKGAEIMIAPILSSAEVAAGTPPHYQENGRAMEATATMEAEPVIRQEWAETNCSTYEDVRTYPDRAIILEIGFRSASLARNILLAWQGKSKAEVGGTTITDEPTRADLVDGDLHSLSQPSDGTATITDSDVGPNPAIEGTHWEWMSGSAQTIRILDVTSLTLPLLVSYDTAASTEVGLMNDMGQAKHMAIEASNAEQACSRERLELYNVMPEGDYSEVVNVAPDSTDENPRTIRFRATPHPDMPADPDLGTLGKRVLID